MVGDVLVCPDQLINWKSGVLLWRLIILKRKLIEETIHLRYLIKQFCYALCAVAENSRNYF